MAIPAAQWNLSAIRPAPGIPAANPPNPLNPNPLANPNAPWNQNNPLAPPNQNQNNLLAPPNPLNPNPLANPNAPWNQNNPLAPPNQNQNNPLAPPNPLNPNPLTNPNAAWNQNNPLAPPNQNQNNPLAPPNPLNPNPLANPNSAWNQNNPLAPPNQNQNNPLAPSNPVNPFADPNAPWNKQNPIAPQNQANPAASWNSGNPLAPPNPLANPAAAWNLNNPLALPNQSQNYTGYNPLAAPNQSQNQQQNPFNPQPNPILNASMLGPSALTLNNQLNQSLPNGLGQSGFGASQSRLGPLLRPEKTLDEKFFETRAAWDPTSPDCRFQHMFYNVAEPYEIGPNGPAKPPNVRQDLWDAAVQRNPDPSRLVPALVVGFAQLKARMDAQAKQANAHAYRLKEMLDKVEELKRKHALETSLKIDRVKQQERTLHHRLIALISRLHMLIPALRGSPIRPEEEQLATALENLESEFRRPGGSGRLRGKINELWMALGTVKAERERDRSNGNDESTEWAIIDPARYQQLEQILAEEYRALDFMIKLLQNDRFDIDYILREGYGYKNL